MIRGIVCFVLQGSGGFVLAILISALALLATFYQLYLQRTHNEKSLKPLGQIDLGDRPKQLYVYLRNNGIGPMLIDQLTFIKDGKSYTTIDGCLGLERRSYMHELINDSVKRVILPNAYLVVFETQFENSEGEAEMNHARKQLTTITLRVDGRDIYDNKITLERDFEWFSRHMLERSGER